MNVGKHKKAGQIIEINCVNFSKTFLSFFLCGSTITYNVTVTVIIIVIILVLLYICGFNLHTLYIR